MIDQDPAENSARLLSCAPSG